MSAKPLSPEAEDIAAAYAIAYPERPSRSKAVAWINQGRKSTGKKGIKPDQARVAIDELVAAGWLAPSIDGQRGVNAKGPSALPGTITRFSELAVQKQLASSVIDGLKGGLYYGQRALYSGQQLRFDLIRGRLNGIEELNPKDADWAWLLEPRAEPYLKKLPGSMRQLACQICLEIAIETFQPITIFLKTCQSSAPQYHELLPIASLGFILAGQFDKARQCFAELPSAAKQSKTTIVAMLANDALIATLTGNDALAHEKIFACIEAEKSGTRKRKVYPEYTSFSLALLSLFRTPTAEGGALLRSLRSMKKSSLQATQFDWLFELAERAQNPATGYYSASNFMSIGGPNLDTLLLAIASQWHVDYALHPSQRNLAALEVLLNKSDTAGYRWVAAEVATVMSCFAKTVAPDNKEHQDNKEWQVESHNWHTKLGTTTLTKLVKTLEVWELSLQLLESLAPKRATAAAEVKKDKPVVQSRLAWRVDSYSDYGNEYGETSVYFDITPVEQRLDKNGKWSSGRAVSLKRLHDKTADIEFLSEQDKKAAAGIDTSYSGWGSSAREYDVGPRSAYRLAGHPHVFNSSGERVDIVERSARLKIDTQKDHLTMTLDPRPRGSQSYLMSANDEGTRIEVTFFTAAQSRIFEAIESGLKVPLAAKQRLLDVVSALAADIPVQSDSQDTASEQHDGDPSPLLQLDYSADSLNLRIQVEPLSGSEQFFPAGEGGEVVFIKGQEGTLQVVRKLAREQELVQSLVGSSTQLSQHYDGRISMQINGADTILELLDELQILGVRCVWPRDIPIVVSARADSSHLNLAIKSAKEWFSASGELQYSTADSLSLSHLLKLISNSPQSRFLELKKGEFLALSATLQAQLQALNTYGTAQSSRDGEHRLHALSVLALEPLLDTAQITADKHWSNWHKRLRKASSQSAELPATLQAELRPYQLEGYQWLARLAELGAGACLADDMGLGKTLQTLALLLQRAPDGAALVVAPTSVTGNWMLEAQRFAPTLNVRLYGGNAEDRKQLLEQIQPFDLLIISYGLLHNDIDTLSNVHWRTVVLDEAQAIKNAATQRAKAARKLSADFRLATTGTPIQNNLMDLHSLFAFLIPGFLGSVAKFRESFALPIERDNDDNARQQLRALVTPFMLRRLKRDVLKDLPARTDITLSVELSGEEAALYEALRKQALDAVMESAEDEGSGSKKLRVLAELTRLRRLCCNPQLIQSEWDGPMAKLALFASTLAELLANQHKVLVFSQFVDHLKIIEAHLQQHNINYQYLDGSTTAKQRTERVTGFQSGVGEVFLISLTAGGTGLNLTAADYVIHMDPWWNPAVEDQASDRAHRIGQKRPVTIYRMVTAGTIEAQIQELHATKRELADSLLSGTDSAKFDLESLLGMLRTPAITQPV